MNRLLGSQPAGFTDTTPTLPVGIQLQCPAFAETMMFRIARMFERGSDLLGRRPPVAAAVADA